MEAFAHVFAVESLVERIHSPDSFRNVVKVMLGDKKLTWGRVVVICEVALLLVHKYPHLRDELMQVMSDACSINNGEWNKL